MTMKTLTIHHEQNGSINIISLDGILNADTSTKFDEILQSISDLEIPRILIETEKLSYISSAGIGCFIGVIKRIRSKGGDIRFVHMESRVKRVFDLLDMSDFFEYYDSMDSAVASYQ